MGRAYEKGIPILAFNASYPEMVRPICATLRRLKTFGIVEVSLLELTHFGAKSFRAIRDEYKRYADPDYTALHQDHVPVIDQDGMAVEYMAFIRDAIELGFDSIMIDGSRLSLQENIGVTKAVVAMAHERDTLVEAELGAVFGHEDGPLPSYDTLFETGMGFTGAEDAKTFVESTGVDWLSVAIGNIHGRIAGAARDHDKPHARLDIERLKEIRRYTGIPLVLHGGSSINSEDLLAATRNGISKINIGTEIRHAYERACARTGNTSEAMDAVSQAIERLVVECYGIAGSEKRLRASAS